MTRGAHCFLLRAARVKAQLTQRELARISGTPQSVIAEYESGRRDPSASALLRLLAITGYDVALQERRSGGTTDRPSRIEQQREAEPVGPVSRSSVPANVPIPCVGRSAKQGEVIVASVHAAVDGALAVVEPLPDTAPASGGDEVARLKQRVEEHLTAQGFAVTNGRILAPVPDKETVRALHEDAVAQQRFRARPALARHESKFLQRLTRGDDINTADIDPALVLVDNYRSPDAALWRWCALHWSIPVSAGYGRRLRFLVVDRAHDNAVMGALRGSW